MNSFRVFGVLTPQRSPLARLRGRLLLEVIAAWLVAGLLLQSATTVAPNWWSVRSVLAVGATAEDYAVANIGQLKNIAKKATQEMNDVPPGGAGTQINALIASEDCGLDISRR